MTTGNEVMATAKAVVAKLDLIHNDPAYRSVWAINQMHAGPYRGPDYADELAALVAAIGEG